jgi:hypothetical protein
VENNTESCGNPVGDPIGLSTEGWLSAFERNKEITLLLIQGLSADEAERLAEELASYDYTNGRELIEELDELARFKRNGLAN